MNISQIINKENSAIPFKQSRFFDYQILPYKVVGFFKDKTSDILYGVDDNNQLRKSTDGGKNWGSVLFTYPSLVSNLGGMYVGGSLLVWLDNGELYRTTDDVTFTKVLTGLRTPLTSGVDFDKNNPSKIMFCEYHTGANLDLHVYFSSDAGATWKTVMTKNNPKDIRHFHSVDCISGDAAEWIVTSGDSGTNIKWWRSTDDGTTWTQIVGGFSETQGKPAIFRTLGVKRIAPESYIWIGDSSKESFIFACGKDDLNLDNRGLPSQVKRVQTLGAHGWGLQGGRHWLVAVDKVESTSNAGEYTNRIMVSGDSGGSWYSELEVTGEQPLYGFAGVLGPDMFGQFYIQAHARAIGHGRQTIKMTPRKDSSYPAKPINQELQMVEYEKTLLNSDKPTTSSTWSAPLMKTIYEPVLEVVNNSDVNVTIALSNGLGSITDLATAKSTSKDLEPNRKYLLSKGDYLNSIIPQGYLIGVKASAAATTGNVTVRLFGKVYQALDHRSLY